MTGYNTWGVSWGTSWGMSWGSGSPAPAAITGGHFLPQGAKRRRTFSNVNVIYDKARVLSRKETKELRDAISEFVEPKIARQAIVPEIVKIDYAALEANQQAYDRFLLALDNLQNNLIAIEEMQNEDEELFQLALIACAIQ